MASNITGSAPDTGSGPDRRSATDAPASLRERAGDLRHQLSDLRRRIDLEARIRAHPLPAVGIALALGALVGLRRRAAPAPEAEIPAGLGGAVTGALTALALRVLKDAALRQLSGAATSWYGKRRDLHGPASTERSGVRDPAAFARH